MGSFGFQNLPNWHDELQKLIAKYGKDQLLRIPVLGSENVEYPWSSLEAEDFFSAIDTGIIFSSYSKIDRFAKSIVTNDEAIAINRIKQGYYQNTFYRAAMGGLFPMLSILNSSFSNGKPNKLIIQNDAVAGFILSSMEKNGKNLEDATREAQWKELVSGNPNLHLHGIVTKNRFVLQVAEIFGKFVDPDLIKIFGINTLELKDIEIASKKGFSIRLLGIAEIINEEVSLCVEACMIPEKYFMAQARGGSEILYISDDKGAAQVYACPGANNETAVRGILSDMFEPIAKHNNFEIQKDVKPLHGHFYIRVAITNTNNAISELANYFTHRGIELKSLEYYDDINDKEVVIITEECERSDIERICEDINKKNNGISIVSLFRFIL